MIVFSVDDLTAEVIEYYRAFDIQWETCHNGNEEKNYFWIDETWAAENDVFLED